MEELKSKKPLILTHTLAGSELTKLECYMRSKDDKCYLLTFKTSFFFREHVVKREVLAGKWMS